jgi:ABC-type phosphate/phosphonate transport system substrate-binding protein
MYCINKKHKLIVFQRLLLFHLLFWVFLPVSFADNAPVIGNIKIGVLAFRGPQHAINKWNPTVSYLGEVLPEYLFQIVPLDLENLQQATHNGEVDFIITNPGNYVSLETAYGASRIATLQNSHRDTTYTRYGAVIISKKSRIDITVT